jgi:hypothetical protein
MRGSRDVIWAALGAAAVRPAAWVHGKEWPATKNALVIVTEAAVCAEF